MVIKQDGGNVEGGGGGIMVRTCQTSGKTFRLNMKHIAFHIV